MEFFTIICTVLSAISVEFPDYASSMDLNDSPAEEPPLNTTTTNHTDSSKLYDLEMELIATENKMHSLMNYVKGHSITGGAIRKAQKQIEELRKNAERKKLIIDEMKMSMGINPAKKQCTEQKQNVKDKGKEIHEQDISMGISPDQGGQERTEGSSSIATSSDHVGSTTVDILKNNLQNIDNEIQQLRDRAIGGYFRGRAVRIAQKKMTSLQEEKIKKQKEIVEEDLRLQLGRNVELEEVERAYIEQERNQRKLELQQRRTEIKKQLDRKAYQRNREGMKKLVEELEHVEKELDE